MVLSKDDVAAIETVEHYIHDEDQCYLMLYGKSLRLCTVRWQCRPTSFPHLLFSPLTRGAMPTTAAVLMSSHHLAGEGVFDTIPIEADYTVGDMKLWIKYHKNKDPSEYDLVGPKGKWKMGAGSEVLKDETIIADVMGERFENKWLMQLSVRAQGR